MLSQRSPNRRTCSLCWCLGISWDCCISTVPAILTHSNHLACAPYSISELALEFPRLMVLGELQSVFLVSGLMGHPWAYSWLSRPIKESDHTSYLVFLWELCLCDLKPYELSVSAVSWSDHTLSTIEFFSTTVHFREARLTRLVQPSKWLTKIDFSGSWGLFLLIYCMVHLKPWLHLATKGVAKFWIRSHPWDLLLLWILSLPMILGKVKRNEKRDKTSTGMLALNEG